MAHPVLSLWLLMAGLWPPARGQQAPEQENRPTPVTQLVSSTLLNNSQFAFSLYRQLMAPDPSKNFLFSPLSFSIPLTLLALQANPEARTQILQDLGFRLAEVPDTKAHTHYSQLLEALLPPTGQCRVDTGSVLFVGQKRDPLRKFVQIAQSLYRMEVFPISFRNSWIARSQIDFIMQQKTHGKITRLLQKVELNSVLILANYIFFKGEWRHHFDPKLTEIRPFSVSKRIVIPVPMMQRLGWFQVQYLYHLHSYVLRLPGTCNTTAVFILPEEGKVGEAEKTLVEGNSDTWTQPFPLSRRKLYLPRFSLSGNIELDQLVLTPGGLDIFSYNSSLSGISLQMRPTKVSKAVHRAELTLDEEGAIHEDVTYLQSLPKYLVPTLQFNRPFLVLIFKEGSHNLLFMGKVINPNTNS